MGIVQEIIKANGSEIYKDSLQPGVRVVGKSLAQCISLFVTPIGRMAEIFEKNINKYLDKLEEVREDQLIEPDTRVLVPILEKLRYIEDEKVSDYYTEILASASRKDQRGRVMLSYIEILNRVTADEIKILEYLNSKENEADISTATEEERQRFGIDKEARFVKLGGELPVIDVKFSFKKEAGYRTIIKNFNNLNEKLNLTNDENIGLYLDNLISLGLLHKPPMAQLAINSIYTPLENNFAKISTPCGENEMISFDKRKIELTDLCKALLRLCQKGNEIQSSNKKIDG